MLLSGYNYNTGSGGKAQLFEQSICVELYSCPSSVSRNLPLILRNCICGHNAAMLLYQSGTMPTFSLFPTLTHSLSDFLSLLHSFEQSIYFLPIFLHSEKSFLAWIDHTMGTPWEKPGTVRPIVNIILIILSYYDPVRVRLGEWQWDCMTGCGCFRRQEGIWMGLPTVPAWEVCMSSIHLPGEAQDVLCHTQGLSATQTNSFLHFNLQFS